MPIIRGSQLKEGLWNTKKRHQSAQDRLQTTREKSKSRSRSDATIKELEHQVHQARRRKRVENKKQMVQKVFECVSAERTRENDLWRIGGSDARAYAQNVRGYSKER